MKAEELRIGNTVLRSGKISTITGYDLWHTEKLSDVNHLVEWRVIEGLPITEELLLRAGFESGASESNSIYYHKKVGQNNFCIRFMRGVSGIYFCLGNECESSYEIKFYFHELQNLFYALTKTELTLKDQ